MKKAKLFIITGMSGAGKSQALKCFEDYGYYCVDNLPADLLPSFLRMIRKKKYLSKAALGIDIREGKYLKDFSEAVKKPEKSGIIRRVIFLDASDHILLQRFSETRHRHPLGKNLASAIREERRILAELKSGADKVIDTSKLTLGELKEIISSALELKQSREMAINIVSFGFKYGLPLDADMVMDVRFLPNPNYVRGLKEKTGMDSPVKAYLKKNSILKNFLADYIKLVKSLLPLYVKEGKSYLTVAVGCTGGRHRSVYIAHEIAEKLARSGFSVSEYHRDIRKN